MRAAGLARGGSLDNAVVVSGDLILNEGGLRYADEFVRHKLLDALGDSTLPAHPLIGHFRGQRSGHSLNRQSSRRCSPIPRPGAHDAVAARRSTADVARAGARPRLTEPTPR